MKIKLWLKRIGVAFCVTLALTAGVASPAFAANTNVDVEYGDHIRGSMTHIDDGDTFRVTDWYADGHGIKGCLDIQHPVNQLWTEIECKYNNVGAGNYVSFGEDVISLYTYRMRVYVQDGANDSTPIAYRWKEFSE